MLAIQSNVNKTKISEAVLTSQACQSKALLTSPTFESGVNKSDTLSHVHQVKHCNAVVTSQTFQSYIKIRSESISRAEQSLTEHSRAKLSEAKQSKPRECRANRTMFKNACFGVLWELLT